MQDVWIKLAEWEDVYLERLEDAGNRFISTRSRTLRTTSSRRRADRNFPLKATSGRTSNRAAAVALVRLVACPT